MESISYKTYLLGRQPAATPAVDDILPILQGGSDVKKIKWLDLLIAAANYCEDTGVVNALAAECSTNFTTYERLTYLIKVANNNTGACTLSLNNMAPKPIKKKGVKALDEGDLIAGQIIMVADGGDSYQMISPTASTKDWHYAVTTGTNNAYALALTPALDAYIPGMPIMFKASFTNTGAATMVIGGLDAVALKKNVSDVLQPGDIVINKIYICFFDGTNIQILNPSAQNNNDCVNDFRLTLTPGVPVTTSDVVGATAIYCTPMTGDQMSLYKESGDLETLTSEEFSLALGTLTDGLLYDVFCYNDSGALALEFLAWASASARATGIVYYHGMRVKSGDITRRYLGVFCASSTTTTEDSEAKRYLENYDNQVNRKLSGTFSSDRSTASATYSQLNAEIQIKWVQGVAENPIHIYTIGTCRINTSGSVVATAVGIDSISVATAGLESAMETSANYSGPIGINNSVILTNGQHYATLLGSMSAGTATWPSTTNANAAAAKVYLNAIKKG